MPINLYHLATDTPLFSLYISDSKGSGISDGNSVRFRHSKHRHFYHKLYKIQYVSAVILCAVYDIIHTLSVAGSKGLYTGYPNFELSVPYRKQHAFVNLNKTH